MDYLHDDHNALRCCSVSSWSLRFAASYHLFSNIAIRDGQKFRRFIEGIRTSPPVSSYIRRLKLESGLHRQPELEPWHIRPTESLPTIMAALSNVREIELSEELPHATDIGAVSRRIQNTRQYKLAKLQVTFTGPAYPGAALHQLAVLSLFSEIGSLAVTTALRGGQDASHHKLYEQLDAYLSLGKTHPLRIRDFVVLYSTLWSPFWMEYFRRIGLTSTLDSMHVIASPWHEQPPSLISLLADVGSNLRSLRLDLVSYGLNGGECTANVHHPYHNTNS